MRQHPFSSREAFPLEARHDTLSNHVHRRLSTERASYRLRSVAAQSQSAASLSKALFSFRPERANRGRKLMKHVRHPPPADTLPTLSAGRGQIVNCLDPQNVTNPQNGRFST